MTLQQAKDFINYNVKEGVYDETVIDGMTDDKIIEFAEEEDARAEMYYSSMQEEL